MKVFPYDAFSIQSKLSLEEIEKLFGTRIEPMKFLRFSGGGARFQGTLKSGEFTMSRIIGYRNSFLPTIKGRIEHALSGTVLHLTMSLDVVTAVFMLMWFGGLFLFAGVGLINGENVQREFLLAPFGMAIFGVALVSGCFWFEAVKQKPMLLEIFQGELIANPLVQSTKSQRQ